MFRSLLSILLIAQLNSPVYTGNPAQPIFDWNEVLMAEAIPVISPTAEKPTIQARSAMLIDVDTGITLFSKNSDEARPMASLTKIMTALLILESHPLTDVVSVQTVYPGDYELGVRMWLRQHERITVESLLTGLLVRSAGDAAIALAEYHSGSINTFVDQMNQRAKELGLKNTHYKNTIGLDESGHESSATDLAILTRHALKNADFRRIVSTKEATVYSTDGAFQHTFQTTNELLGSETLDIRGVKTGTTDAAGACVINLARLQGDKEILVILLDSPDRFGESETLINWAKANITW